MSSLAWKKYHPLSDQNAFICLVEHMGNDSSIVQAARVSYGKDEQEQDDDYQPLCNGKPLPKDPCITLDMSDNDRRLIRYLMNHSHTTPFEMVEIKFMVQIPMDHWRQWIRHRTANVNEYSTRYTEALDFFQVTQPTEWRLQTTDNKQGSSGYLTNDIDQNNPNLDHSLVIDSNEYQNGIDRTDAGSLLSNEEHLFHKMAKRLYNLRLALGIAKEQARKDLPLSTYTRAYWKCDLHNIFNFLRLRMDSRAQLEIRSFANCMYEIVKQICPVACEAFEDYVLNAKKFSRMEMGIIKELLVVRNSEIWGCEDKAPKPNSMTDREWKELLEKLQ